MEMEEGRRDGKREKGRWHRGEEQGRGVRSWPGELGS